MPRGPRRGQPQHGVWVPDPGSNPGPAPAICRKQAQELPLPDSVPTCSARTARVPHSSETARKGTGRCQPRHPSQLRAAAGRGLDTRSHCTACWAPVTSSTTSPRHPLVHDLLLQRLASPFPVTCPQCLTWCQAHRGDQRTFVQ